MTHEQWLEKITYPRRYRPKNGLIKLCLKKRGEYRDRFIQVRDLRFINNSREEK